MHSIFNLLESKTGVEIIHQNTVKGLLYFTENRGEYQHNEKGKRYRVEENFSNIYCQEMGKKIVYKRNKTLY